MVEVEPKTTDGSNDTPAKARTQWRWQWNLKTLLLLMAVIATWTAYYRTSHETERLRGQLDALRELAAELVVADPAQFAIVSSPEQWMGDQRWEVYLPPDSDYGLKLATRKIDKAGVAAAAEEVRLSHGRHQISLERIEGDDHWEINVELDGRAVIRVRESSDWAGDLGGASRGDTRTQQFPTSEPLILERVRFLVEGNQGQPRRPQLSIAGRSYYEPLQPSNGIVLWIEKDHR